MQRKKYHPDAYLERKRNVIRGLKARTKILEVMGRERTHHKRSIELSSFELFHFTSSLTFVGGRTNSEAEGKETL